MYKETWNNCYHSVAGINVLDDNGIEIGYFSGFKTSNFLLTDPGIFQNKRAQVVVIKFVSVDGVTVNVSKKIPYTEFVTRHINDADKTSDQFAVININYQEFEKIPGFILSDEEIFPGMSVALLGYQYDLPNLTIKSGILSSVVKYPENKNYLHFDGFIKKGNSGGPLVSVETGKVIGIIGYKLNKALKTYNQLVNIINANIEVLKESEGEFKIMEVDPVQVLIVNQNQIKQLANEIYKSASAASGYALSSKNIAGFFKHNRIDLQRNKDALFNAR